LKPISSQLPDFSAHPVVPLQIIHTHRTFVFLLRVFPCSLEPEKSILIHDVTLLVHPRRHVDSVQLSFHDTLLPPPVLPASASARVKVAIGCSTGASSSSPSSALVRLPLLFLASTSFSTEEPRFPTCSWENVGFPTCSKPLGVQSPFIGRARLHTTQSFRVWIVRSHSSRPSSSRPSHKKTVGP
jgi:hypothetical protein